MLARHEGEDGLMTDVIGLSLHALIFEVDGREGGEEVTQRRSLHPHRHSDATAIVRFHVVDALAGEQHVEGGLGVLVCGDRLLVVEIGVGTDMSTGKSQFLGGLEVEVLALRVGQTHLLSEVVIEIIVKFRFHEFLSFRQVTAEDVDIESA